VFERRRTAPAGIMTSKASGRLGACDDRRRRRYGGRLRVFRLNGTWKMAKRPSSNADLALLGCAGQRLGGSRRPAHCRLTVVRSAWHYATAASTSMKINRQRLWDSGHRGPPRHGRPPTMSLWWWTFFQVSGRWVRRNRAASAVPAKSPPAVRWQAVDPFEGGRFLRPVFRGRIAIFASAGTS